MKKGYFSVGTAVLLSLGLFTSQALAQTESFCSATGHSGESVQLDYNHVGTVGSKGYELWCDKNTTSCKATFYADGSMNCQFQNADDYLCRSGLMLQSQGKTYDQFGGDIYAEYKLVKGNASGVDYSYVGVYGWMENVPGAQNGLVEYYIVDNSLSQWMPGDWVGNEKIAENVSIDGGTYNVYRNTRTGPAIGHQGDVTFYQYFSIRSSMRDCGTINISAHMRKWEELGLKMGKLYEARVLGEAGHNNGNQASGSVDFPHANVFIADGTTPTSSASTNPTSSATSQEATASLPGTIEMESFETNGGDEVTIYGDVVGEVKPGAYLEWTVDVANAGIYSFEVLAARADEEGRESTISLLIDGTTVGAVSVLTDTDWSDLHYKTFSGTTSTSIASGKHTLRVSFDDGYVNVDNIKFTAQGTESLASNIRMSLNNDKSVQVFDMQGRALGRVSVAAGASLQDALFARFHKSGIYLVKQGSRMMKVRVTR